MSEADTHVADGKHSPGARHLGTPVETNEVRT